MPQARHMRTKVLAEHRIELYVPWLEVGQSVDIVITPATAEERPRRSALDIIESLPPGRLFKTSEEADAYLQGERDSWERGPGASEEGTS